MTLAGTALGALVGVGATLLAERARWRREAAERARQERKEIYVACLTSFRQAHETMRAVAFGDRQWEATGLDAAVREALRASGCNEARDAAALFAAPGIVAAIDDAFYSLRRLMDVLAAGNGLRSAAFQEAQAAHRIAVKLAQAAMRRDLGSEP
ncbi:hypothetical protein [Streptomyces ureilyticus]|uniref:Protein kilB n=1 Tax=Streptomyces ureilyticus TaxID=1775131 RepID=A0ABX0DQ77_9ACTN|nr:hypothetical protein [Streptomyces ureilyticus]NGO42860.1 hypothetical protein [Streptomyces ureilyticus]